MRFWRSKKVVPPARIDRDERLGGCSDPLLAEIDQAMRELWLARTNLREAK